MMNRYYYSSTIQNFLTADENNILGELSKANAFSLELTQRDAWLEQIVILKKELVGFEGSLYFEYSIPRMGKRIDVVCIIGSVLFLLEFKVGEKTFPVYAIDQVMDYALDLKNFHETSHDLTIAPILVSTSVPQSEIHFEVEQYDDQVISPLRSNASSIHQALRTILNFIHGRTIDPGNWETGRYSPTPTIVEAAMALYRGHSVADISRNDAGAINLTQTTQSIDEIIKDARENHKKSICFVTGVPGAGKTLVGLNVATTHIDSKTETYSVFLSGNGPLVDILREALARDKVDVEKAKGITLKKGIARSEVKAFIQNVHNFRDESLVDQVNPPNEHVVLFDEAQRAWNLEQTSNFMRRKKGFPNFNQSEPEFLISCMDRHKDWAVIICLVGGGQEINVGEAGIGEWIRAIDRSFREWQIYISPNLTDSEYRAKEDINRYLPTLRFNMKSELHLATSMRSFRAENVSLLVKQILDLEGSNATKTLQEINKAYPIVLTRDLVKAKKWIREKARGTERYGMVVSSQAIRLKPLAVDVRATIDPIHWFLDGKSDVRSSYYLEDVATEFQIQGLELDWTCLVWDADLRFAKNDWEYKSFVGEKWNNINKEERKNYLKNAYRVLLTRARQGMVIVVPEGDEEDPTRSPKYYTPTYNYLESIGFEKI
jgi:hypothetical protein